MSRVSKFLGLVILLTAIQSRAVPAASAVRVAHECDLALDPAVFASHVAERGLIQFRVPGVAQFQGRVVERDKQSIRLQGQYGAPRRFLIENVKDLKILRTVEGRAVTEFTPITGSEISRALREAAPTRGSFEDAVMFALDAHGPQIYNDVHYGIHLDEVVAVLTRFGISDPDVRIAAILHDVIEDAGVSYEVVRERFGAKVANAVRAVSLPGGVPRDEAFERLYPAIRATPGALWVKLADRIANVEDALRVAAKGDPRHLAKYAREWAHFRESLSAEADATAIRMFEHLDVLFTDTVH